MKKEVGGWKWAVVLVGCAVAVVVVVGWPWNPEVRIERMSVKRVKVRPVGAEVWIAMSVRLRNHDIYWMEMGEVDVGVKYRGKKMGHVEKKGWVIRAWASTHVDGDLQFSGLPPPEVAHLLEDLAKGQVYFRSVVEVTGQFGFLFSPLPLEFKTILACEILVNTKNHSIILQHCLHKD